MCSWSSLSVMALSSVGELRRTSSACPATFVPARRCAHSASHANLPTQPRPVCSEFFPGPWEQFSTGHQSRAWNTRLSLLISAKVHGLADARIELVEEGFVSDTGSYIRWFREIGLRDVALVGGKNASLGELYRELTGVGVHVPNGFAITADGYKYFMQASGLAERVTTILRGLDVTNLAELAQRGLAIRQAITATELPSDLKDA